MKHVLPSAAKPALTTATAAILAALFAAPVSAQVLEARPQEEFDVDPMLDDGLEIEPAYSVTAGVSFVTEYFFRGISQGPANQEGLFNGGLIAQPYVELGIPILVPEGREFALSATVGQWNSFGSEQTGSGPSNWYESDLYAGLAFETGDLGIAAFYTFYTSPNGSFSTVQEVALGADYGLTFGDDPESEEDFIVELGLSALIAAEIDNTAAGIDEGIYLELGVEPSFEVEVSGVEEPVALSFPVTLGFGLQDYYFDDTGDDEIFGYVSVGAAASFPLPVPARYGAWTITPSVEGLFLSADSLQAGNNDDDVLLIGALTAEFSF
jgi:hypothetical protein